MIHIKRNLECREQGHVLIHEGKEWRAGDLGQLPDGIVVQLTHRCLPHQNPTWYWEQMSDEYSYYPDDVNPERLL